MSRRVAALCAALLLAAPAVAQGEPCRLPRLAKVEIAQSDDGDWLVPVTINGATEYFELSGNPWSRVYEADADRLNFGSHHHERDDALFFGTDQVTTRRTAELIEGKVRWKEFEFYPIVGPKPPGIAAIGSLGMDFLESAQLDVELNAAAGEINFIRAGACAAPPWSRSQQGRPLGTGEAAVLPLSLDGRPMWGVIDARLESSALDVSALLTQFKLTPASPGVTLPAAQGPFHNPNPVHGYTFKALDIGEAELAAPALAIVDTHVEGADEAFRRHLQALNPYEFAPRIRRSQPFNLLWLGRAELRRLRIYFMFHAGKVFISPVPGAPNAGFSTAAATPLADVGQ